MKSGLRTFLGVVFIFGSVAFPALAGDIRVSDFRGKTISFSKPAERIVCLIESALSGLYMLDAGDRVVGISRNVYQTDVFPYYAALDPRIRSRQLPAPGNWDFVSFENVLALKPDLVVIWSRQAESINRMEERGIPVYGVFVHAMEDVYKEIDDLGRLTGRSERASELIEKTRESVRRLSERTAGIPPDKKPSVYYMWAQGNLETSCSGSTVNALIELAGGRNVCGHIRREHTTVNLESLIAWNPEVVILWHNPRKDPEDLLADPRWQRISAVQSRRVHEFPEIFLCDLWTLKFAFAVKMAAQWMHPDLFGGIDLNMEKERMFSELYGKKFFRGAP